MKIKSTQLTPSQINYCKKFKMSKINGIIAFDIPDDEIQNVKGIRFEICPHCKSKMEKMISRNGNFLKCKNCLKKY